MTVQSSIVRLAAIGMAGAAMLGLGAVRASRPPTIADAAICPAPELAGIDAWIDTLRRQRGDPGLTLVVTTDRCIVHARGFGWRDLARRRPVTVDTLFQIGSLTKGFTALGIGLLVERGRLDWDAPVRSVLPHFAMPPQSGPSAVTIGDLLSHRTGMAGHDALWYGAPSLTPRQITSRIAYLQPLGPPRSTFRYNNLMYTVAGHAIEAASGERWDGYMRGHVLGPLGMSRATTSLHGYLADSDHALPYFLSKAGPQRLAPRDLGGMVPAGGLGISGRQIARYMQMLLGSGTLDGTRLAGPATIAAMWTSRGPRGEDASEPGATRPDYGYGFNIDQYHGERRVHHTGSIDGFHARLLLFPARRIGIFVVGNLNATRTPEVVGNAVADRLLGLPSPDWNRLFPVASVETDPAKLPPTATLPPIRTGRYTHPAYGTVCLNGPSGMITLHDRLKMRLIQKDGGYRTARLPGLPDYPGTDAAVAFSGTNLTIGFAPDVSPIIFRKAASPGLDCNGARQKPPRRH